MKRATARRERQRIADSGNTADALAIVCPTCGTGPGVYCYVSLGPEMHEGRHAATRREYA